MARNQHHVTALAAACDRALSRTVTSESGCWIYTGYIKSNGYGSLTVPGVGNWYVHRLTYTVIVGPIADGLQVDHLCLVKSCCNPAHLEPACGRARKARAA